MDNLYDSLKEQIKNKSNWLYLLIGAASTLMFTRFILMRKRSKPQIKNKNRLKNSKRYQRLFNFEGDISNIELKVSNLKSSPDDMKFSKLNDFMKTMVTKTIVKEELVNSKVKQDYIFYQIMNNMQERFKTKNNPILN